MIHQTIFSLSAKKRGCHLITSEILKNISSPLPQTGLLNLFVQHTSCSLFGVSLTIPISNRRLALGTWQGIYLCEFRNYGVRGRLWRQSISELPLN